MTPDPFSLARAEPQPIDTAPVQRGNPVLLYDPAWDGWQIGHWDGQGWFHEGGLAMAPTHWSALPGVP